MGNFVNENGVRKIEIPSLSCITGPDFRFPHRFNSCRKRGRAANRRHRGKGLIRCRRSDRRRKSDHHEQIDWTDFDCENRSRWSVHFPRSSCS